MEQFELKEATDSEVELLDDCLNEYNQAMVAMTQEKAYRSFRYAIHNQEGQVVAGISAYSVLWHILYIDVLWVHQDYRKQKLGQTLLKKVEVEGRAYGCHVSHLETFDFQGKEFYLKQGYQVFGTLRDSPKNHSEYFMSKVLH